MLHFECFFYILEYLLKKKKKIGRFDVLLNMSSTYVNRTQMVIDALCLMLDPYLYHYCIN